MNEGISYHKDDVKIVLFEGVHPRARQVFEDHGYRNVERLKTALTGDALIDKIRDARMIGIRSRTQITADVLQQAARLTAIGCFCIGTNQVDLDAASEKGAPVFNAPHSNTRSVAELVIGEVIMLYRGVFTKSMAAHHKQWRKTAKDSHEVRGKTIGIVGYGHIGSQVSILAEAMGMRVIYFDIHPKLPLGNAKAVASLQDLLAEADVTTLHVPEDESTRNMMDRERLAQMKPGAYLINASRGSVVDIETMAAMLKTGALRGAAIDVFPREPKSNEDPFESALIGLDNVIMTPHIGGSTLEAQEDIGAAVAAKLAQYTANGATVGAVNFPEASLPRYRGAHRILHIHRNVPGVLKEINRSIAAEDINVLGQYLATDTRIGYVILDIAKDVSHRLLDRIKGIEGTIRARVLY